MHTVQLKLDDSIYSNVMFLLNNLNIKGLEIKENKKIEFTDADITVDSMNDTDIFSNHSANLIEDWKDLSEDEVWN